MTGGCDGKLMGHSSIPVPSQDRFGVCFTLFGRTAVSAHAPWHSCRSPGFCLHSMYKTDRCAAVCAAQWTGRLGLTGKGSPGCGADWTLLRVHGMQSRGLGRTWIQGTQGQAAPVQPASSCPPQSGTLDWGLGPLRCKPLQARAARQRTK